MIASTTWHECKNGTQSIMDLSAIYVLKFTPSVVPMEKKRKEKQEKEKEKYEENLEKY